jgi:hypothetical protein
MKTLRRKSVVDNENPLKGLKFFLKQLPKCEDVIGRGSEQYLLGGTSTIA